MAGMDLSDPTAGNGIVPGQGSGYAQFGVGQPGINNQNNVGAVMQQQALQNNSPSRVAMIVQQLQQNAQRGAQQLAQQPGSGHSGTPYDAFANVLKAYNGSNAQTLNNMQDPNSGFWSPTVTPGG